jgi:WD40 repeat protein
VALSDGRVAVGLMNGALWLLDPEGAPEAWLPAHSDRVGVLVASPDGRRLASAGWDGLVLVLDPRGGGAADELPR